MKVYQLIIFILTMSIPAAFFTVEAQPGIIADSNLALKYYQTKEFAKAAVVYKALYEKNPSKNYYIYYLNSLWEIQDFDEAEKLIKKAAKSNKTDLSYEIDLGYQHIRMGKRDKGEEIYQKALNDLKPDQQAIRSLASAFSGRGEYQLSVQTYLRGRELLKNSTLFRNELSNAYTMTRNYEGMIQEGLADADENPQAILIFKNRFQALLRGDVQDNIYEMVRKTLLQKVQSNPQQIIYSELLIWLFLQKNDFQSAFMQAKALDIRLKEDGSRIFSLAESAVFNDKPELAEEMYAYLTARGPKSIFYVPASIALSKIRFASLLSQPDQNNAEIKNLHDSISTQLEFLGSNAESKELFIHLAHLKAFYLGETDLAIQILEREISARETKADIRSKMKLELADIHLYSRDRWEAAILYGQVEKENENNVTGHEAKLKKAKLAYYTGDFRWAEAQLNVLKASTSKLIANDALYLSQLIQNNINEEGNNIALQLYAEADLFVFKKLESQALLNLDSIIMHHPGDAILDETYYSKAEVLLRQGKYLESISALEFLLTNLQSESLGDDALFLKAKVTEEKLKNPEDAMNLYQDFLIRYPSSIFSVEARKRFRELRGDSHAS